MYYRIARLLIGAVSWPTSNRLQIRMQAVAPQPGSDCDWQLRVFVPLNEWHDGDCGLCLTNIDFVPQSAKEMFVSSGDGWTLSVPDGSVAPLRDSKGGRIIRYWQSKDGQHKAYQLALARMVRFDRGWLVPPGSSEYLLNRRRHAVERALRIGSPAWVKQR